MMGNWGWGNMGYGASWGHGLGWVFMILFWLAIILAVAALLKWLVSASSRAHLPREKTALEILRERYARGEIDRDEYERKRHDLAH
ncbi:MAG: SHOCT domain-containing protein [Acidiferrobacterales bacterium]